MNISRLGKRTALFVALCLTLMLAFSASTFAMDGQKLQLMRTDAVYTDYKDFDGCEEFECLTSCDLPVDWTHEFPFRGRCEIVEARLTIETEWCCSHHIVWDKSKVMVNDVCVGWFMSRPDMDDSKVFDLDLENEDLLAAIESGTVCVEVVPYDGWCWCEPGYSILNSELCVRFTRGMMP